MIKKLLFFLFTIFMSVNMMAGEVTILPTDFTPVENSDYSVTKDGVTVSVVASTVTSDQMRIFKGKTITISSDSVITSIVFTCTANGTAKYGPGGFAAQDGYTFEASGKKGTWVGSATSVEFTAETNQVRAAQIVVTINCGSIDTIPTDTTSQDTTVIPVDPPTPIEFPEENIKVDTASVNGDSAYKIGTSKADGTLLIDIPKNSIGIFLYIAAWKDKPGEIYVLKKDEFMISRDTLELRADDGISNNSPFTIETDLSTFLFELELSGVNTDTQIALVSGTARRFVVWGISTEQADPGISTGINNVEDKAKGYKVFDGKQILIIKNGKTFNLLGQRLD